MASVLQPNPMRSGNHIWTPGRRPALSGVGDLKGTTITFAMRPDRVYR